MEKIGIFQLLHLPDSFTGILLVLSLVFLLSPYLAGADFGFFKVPTFSSNANKRLKIAGPFILLCVLSCFVPFLPKGAPTNSGSAAQQEKPAPRKNEKPQRVYDVEADFSDSTNPNGSWTYGFFEGLPMVAELVLCGRTADPKPGLVCWAKPTWPWPNITCNVSDHPINLGQVVWEPRQVTLHPGNGGLYSVVRWTATIAGTYKVDAKFTGHNPKPTSSDVYIVKNGREVYKKGEVIGFGVAQVFSEFLFFNPGDTLDFAVGPGPLKDFGGDDTSLDLKISQVS